jgi:hypothetical protein
MTPEQREEQEDNGRTVTGNPPGDARGQSELDVEESDVTDTTKPGGDGQTSDAGEGSADVQGTDGGRNPGQRGSRSGGRGTRNNGPSSTGNVGQGSNIEPPEMDRIQMGFQMDREARQAAISQATEFEETTLLPQEV